MKVKTNGITFNNVFFEERENEIRLKARLDTDISAVKDAFESGNEIEYLDNKDTLVFKVFTKCALENITRGKECYIFSFKKITREAELEEQVTNLELALCEIYEAMGV